MHLAQTRNRFSQPILAILVALMSLLVAVSANQKWTKVSYIGGNQAAGSDEQQPMQQQQASGVQLVGGQDEAGERVDKLASAAGDLLWRPLDRQQHQLAYNKRQQAEDPFWALNMGNRIVDSGRHDRFQDETDGGYLVGDSSGNRNYRTLVNDFKHWSHMNNPMREGRAFKPKLMSTARGFGKRSSSPNEAYLSYADLLAMVSPSASNQAMLTNGKMSGNAIR